ncbi:MAG: hypothetical protein FWD68_08550 [Alphaproteobacteria bacterium]|nr:hypothetical protein [Alphaproteobacteria bacterium]
MTTIAYRDNVLAADGRVTLGDLIVGEACRKITRLADGSLFALCGDDTHEAALIEWLDNIADGGAWEPPPKGEEFTAIHVEDSGISVYHGDGENFRTYPYTGFAAWGSGADLAIGAMEMGATAAEAVKVACRRNMATGGTIQIEHVRELN